MLGLDVVHRCIELLLELLNTVVDAVQIRAEADHLVDRLGGFLNMGIAHAAEPQLLSMEGCSIRTVDGRRRAKADERLITCTEGAVVQQPGDTPPLILKLRIR